ncbi:MAG: sulfite oxidase-like oxidoreductase, partial [Ferruginibacter sp.]|nr:sulfite oxidase-like oxidoreductase [Ferruginibacter sp.]
MEESQKLKRIVEARMKLKGRFETKIGQTPSMADDRPMGKGKPNRHGMPLIPVGQVLTKNGRYSTLACSPI